MYGIGFRRMFKSHVISNYDETRTGREAEAERIAFFFALGKGED
jgi:hypothetical protein